MSVSCPTFEFCTSGNCNYTLSVADEGFQECWITTITVAALGVWILIYSRFFIRRSWTLTRLWRCCFPTEPPPETPVLFTSYTRSFDNFVRPNTDPQMRFPPGGGSDYEPTSIREYLCGLVQSTETWSSLLQSDRMVAVLWSSLGWAVVGSSLSSFLVTLKMHNEACSTSLGAANITPWTNTTEWELQMLASYLEQLGRALSETYSDYKFFPLFMLIGYLGFIVSRWRDWHDNALNIQGRIVNLALLFGALESSPSMERRQKLYRLYRYLNLAHAMCYQRLSPALKDLSNNDFVEMGLLTSDEAILLSSASNKQRGAICAWIAAECHDMDTFMYAQVDRLRGMMDGFHDNFVRDNPNTYLTCCSFATSCLCLLIIIGFPIDNNIFVYVPRPEFAYCFQPVVIFNVFLMLTSFRGALVIIDILRNPFQFSYDLINIDPLMTEVDSYTWVCLRSRFDDEFRVSGNDEHSMHDPPRPQKQHNPLLPELEIVTGSTGYSAPA